MGFRQVYIKTANELRLKNNNLLIIKKDENIELPLEDISTIFLEDPYTIITSMLLTELSEYSISMIICNKTFMPSTHILPYNKHYLQSKNISLQINATTIFNNNLWKQIIYKKIENQLKVVQFTSCEEITILKLNSYLKTIKVADKDNREAIAAKIFFTSLYGEEFIRFGTSSITSALNYGYSILHGAIVRNLTSIGLNTCFGIWHDSNLNAYNLASDLIEPFRPIIDYYVYWNKDSIYNPLDKNIRLDLINILNNYMLFEGKECTIEYCINKCCSSYLNALQHNDFTLLKLPTIISQNLIRHE